MGNRRDKSDRWEAWLRQLKEFKEEHGHCDVPEKHPGGLGDWVRNQRVLKGVHLTLEMINRSLRTLVSLGIFLADGSTLHAVNGVNNRTFIWNIRLTTQIAFCDVANLLIDSVNMVNEGDRECTFEA